MFKDHRLKNEEGSGPLGEIQQRTERDVTTGKKGKFEGGNRKLELRDKKAKTERKRRVMSKGKNKKGKNGSKKGIIRFKKTEMKKNKNENKNKNKNKKKNKRIKPTKKNGNRKGLIS